MTKKRGGRKKADARIYVYGGDNKVRVITHLNDGSRIDMTLSWDKAEILVEMLKRVFGSSL
ncbi:MAG TPA: hypothetical protein ENK81_03005 [Euryarchaeota archaeon]|nr:hypothetical protein [Euryarchaeota archaeon]